MHGNPPHTLPHWLRRLLRVPLFAKIVVANGVLMGVLGGLAIFVVPSLHLNGNDGWMAAVWVGGIVAVIAVNGLLVHLALWPIRNLEAVARRVQAGEVDARVAPSPLADREINRVMEVVNRMLESLETGRRRQIELSARLLEAEERERKRISAELLDGTAQLLSATLLHLKVADRGIGTEGGDTPVNGRTRAALDAAREDVLSALAGIQGIARGLRPPELDELGPLAALETQARKLTTETKVRVEFGGDPIEPWLDPWVGLALYRILQEGLANAIAHGDPGTVRVRFELDDGRIRAVLSDDGRGFDTEAIATNPERHVGILRMLERARHAGGEIAIESWPNMGTRLSVDLPRNEISERARAADAKSELFDVPAPAARLDITSP